MAKKYVLMKHWGKMASWRISEELKCLFHAEAAAVLCHICISVVVIFLPWCMGNKLWCLGRKSVALPVYWVGDQRRKGSSRAQQTACFSNWWAGLMLHQFLLNCRSRWGVINLRLRAPWHLSAQKADILLPVVPAVLEEPRGAAGCRGTFGADFIILFYIFFILLDVFKMEPLLQTDCLWQHELGKWDFTSLQSLPLNYLW